MTVAKIVGTIKVIKAPAGEAPLWVRQAWIGLILPYNSIPGLHPDGGSGYLNEVTPFPKRYGYAVLQDYAMLVLEDKNFRISMWWKGKGFPYQNTYFVFSEEEVVVVK